MNVLLAWKLVSPWTSFFVPIEAGRAVSALQYCCYSSHTAVLVCVVGGNDSMARAIEVVSWSALHRTACSLPSSSSVASVDMYVPTTF